VGRAAEQLALRDARKSEGSRDTRDHPDGDEDQHFAHDQPNHLSMIGTESHAYANLASALRHDVGHDPVKANDGEKRGKNAGDGGQAGNHALGRKRVFDLHVSGPHIVDKKIGFHVTDFQTHCGRQLIRIHGGSKVDGHAAEEASGEIRNEGLLGNLVAKIRV
jgi:hypothetical protein